MVVETSESRLGLLRLVMETFRECRAQVTRKSLSMPPARAHYCHQSSTGTRAVAYRLVVHY